MLARLWNDERLRPWLGVAAGLIAAALALIATRGWFSHAQADLKMYPARSLAAGLVLAGLLYLRLPGLIRAAERLEGRALLRLMAVVLTVGFGLRVLMLFTTPALEDDFYRYLWDGGVTASGHNPYRTSPADAEDHGIASDKLKALAVDADIVHTKINHPALRTIYPPVAQAAFAVAHFIEPWSLLAWRLVCLTGELASLGLLLGLLKAVGRSPVWVALYWWNPLVIKELVNSAHMEAVLMPLVLAALLLAARRRPVAATGFLALAAGTKLWPVVLAPLIWRPLLAEPRRLALAAGILGCACALWAAPILMAGLGPDSGFVAYANYWKTNSALMPALERALGLSGGSPETAAKIARALVAAILAATALRMAVKPAGGADDLLRRAAAVLAALYLLSPAQFPWYFIWLAPMLVLFPVRGWLLGVALIPLYYVSFYFRANAPFSVWRDVVLWAIWLPIWGVLISDAWRADAAWSRSLKARIAERSRNRR
jgi:alpha-1,6-mannosyltransferase